MESQIPDGLIPFTVVCLVAAWWAKGMFQLLLAHIPWFQSGDEPPARKEPSIEGIEVEELTVDEEIVLATVEEPEETVPVIVSSEMAGPVLAERFVAAPAAGEAFINLTPSEPLSGSWGFFLGRLLYCAIYG